MLGYASPFLSVALIFKVSWYLTIHSTTLTSHTSPLFIRETVSVLGHVSGAQCMLTVSGRLCLLSSHWEKLRLNEINCLPSTKQLTCDWDKIWLSSLPRIHTSLATAHPSNCLRSSYPSSAAVSTSKSHFVVIFVYLMLYYYYTTYYTEWWVCDEIFLYIVVPCSYFHWFLPYPTLLGAPFLPIVPSIYICIYIHTYTYIWNICIYAHTCVFSIWEKADTIFSFFPHYPVFLFISLYLFLHLILLFHIVSMYVCIYMHMYICVWLYICLALDYKCKRNQNYFVFLILAYFTSQSGLQANPFVFKSQWLL